MENIEFNDEHKQEMGGSFIPEGVHKVKLGLITFEKDDSDRVFADISVFDEEDREGNARLWFHTDGAKKYSFNTLRSIFVHNAPEDKKEATREKINNLKNLEEMDAACQELIGKECWYLVERDPSRKYVGQDGKERESLNRNVYGYEPKPSNPTPQPKEDVKTNSGDGDEPFPSNF